MDQPVGTTEQLRSTDIPALQFNLVQACLSRDSYRRESYEMADYMDDVLSALLNNDPAEAQKLAESAMAKWSARRA
jgi:hypothetical protein